LLFPFLFRYLPPPNGLPLISFQPKPFDDRQDFLKAHTVHGFRRGPFRHRPGVSVDLTVGPEEEFGVEQVLVNTLQMESFRTSFLMDVQDNVSVTHHSYLHFSNIRSTSTPLRLDPAGNAFSRWRGPPPTEDGVDGFPVRRLL